MSAFTLKFRLRKTINLMPAILKWLAQHRVVHAVILSIYFMLVVLPHEWLGKWIYATFFPGDIDRYNFYFLTAGLLASLAFFIPLFRFWSKQKSGRRRTVVYFVLTLGLMCVAYFTIFVLATELIHFPQYAIMAILLFPFSWRFSDTLYWATLLGALDEAYQYFYLSPHRTDYYDFNDVIINLLGAAMGLVFLHTLSDRLPTPRPRTWKQSPTLWCSGALLLLLPIAVHFGWLAIYPADTSPAPEVLLVKKVPERFWSKFHHIRYHVILPEEGLLLLALLFGIYSGLDKSHQPSNPAFPPGSIRTI